MPVLSDQSRRKIGQLLYKAETALNRGRLTEPVEDNAYFHYLGVLAIDPENATALEGLDNIVESYLEQAQDRIYRGELKSAADLLMKARSVEPGHPNLAAVQKRLDEQKSLKSRSFPLSVKQLGSRSHDLSLRLQDIGRLVKLHRAFVMIKAPSDADCRWIYQELNRADEAGIRADFRYENTPQVILFYPP